MAEEMLLTECVNYFKSNKGFYRALSLIREKYKSLGNLGGVIQLSNLTNEEKEALTGYLKKDCFKKNISIKVDTFVKALEETKYVGIDLIRVLNRFFEEDLISKKDERTQYEHELAHFFNHFIQQFNQTRAQDWLTQIKDKKENAYKMVIQKYNEDQEQLYKILVNVCEAVNLLSFDLNQLIRLAVLSSLVTKDPHYFDEDTFANKLLIYAISDQLSVPYPENAEQRNELLYKAGLIKDEVSNFTLCSGLMADSDEGNHEGWEGFYNRSEPLQVSLLNISQINRVFSPSQKVYLFENATVFTEVYERTKPFKPPLMCTFGNIKLASLILLDKLVQSGTKIYYSGDFDPEGLLIVDKLLTRYPNQLNLWGYTIENYQNNLSKQPISQQRLNKLSKIRNKNLMELVTELKHFQVASYQELLIDYYVNDLIKSYC